MKNILLDDKEKQTLSELINNNCRRLFYDSVNIALEMNSRFLLIGPEFEEAATQNRYGEAISIGIDEISSFERYEKQMKIFLEDIKIEDVWILRTLLYFSDFVPTPHKQTNKEVDREVTGIKALEALEQITTGGFNEFLVNPESGKTHELDNRFTNLMDSGLIFKTNSGYITYYSLHNSTPRRFERLEDPFHNAAITERYKIINIADVCGKTF